MSDSLKAISVEGREALRVDYVSLKIQAISLRRNAVSVIDHELGQRNG